MIKNHLPEPIGEVIHQIIFYGILSMPSQREDG
jgi:hypothetical protein